MQQESSQSDLAERDVPTRSRARFPGGAAEGAGAERVCLSVRPCVCLPPQSLVCLGHTHKKPSSFSASTVWTRNPRLWIHRCPPPVFTTEGPLDAPVPIEEEEGGGGGGGHPCHSSTTRLTHRWSA